MGEENLDTEKDTFILIVSSQEEERPLLGPATAPVHISLTSVAWSIRIELVTS